ncbi:MAG TPA: hypothetical protein VMX57_09460 [Planctomycetota bacterium]|nr:hypothetical protein [Planctomycetota bacterium]
MRDLRCVGRVAWGALTFAAVMLWCTPAPAPVVKTRRMVALKVIALRGCRTGEELEDKELGELAEKVRQKLKLKRLEVIDTVHMSANSGLEITTSLGDDMKIKMRWRGVQQDTAKFKITVLRGKATLIQSDVVMKLTEPSVLMGKFDKDSCLVLLMSSEVDEDDE